MEMSAEDMYQMYTRMSSEMRSQHFPANLDDLWTALIASPYFQNKGAHVDDARIWHLPETGRHSELAGTIDRNAISEKTEFLTWGSTTLDNLFEEIIGDRISEMQCIRKVSVSEDHAELVGYAVASAHGPVFITSYDQLKDVKIDPSGGIEDAFLDQCTAKLRTVLRAETSQMRLAKRAEEKNKEIAELHEKLLSSVTASILKQKEGEGAARFTDAIKSLENNPKEMYYVDLPVPVFSGKATQLLFPIALEGALKLKEVSYIHAEAYPGGELKHGPIALIEPSFPTFVLASDPDMLSKNISNMTEIKARRGNVIALGIEGYPFPKDLCDDVFYLPKVHEALLPIITVLPLQLFAYYAALERGCDVDKPRNLAKAVTVE